MVQGVPFCQNFGRWWSHGFRKVTQRSRQHELAEAQATELKLIAGLIRDCAKQCEQDVRNQAIELDLQRLELARTQTELMQQMDKL